MKWILICGIGLLPSFIPPTPQIQEELDHDVMHFRPDESHLIFVQPAEGDKYKLYWQNRDTDTIMELK